ncbi:MAG: hypothetical protein NT112_02390, partial [Methanoregula sp.]|nr:hypothetical protein [Methanoregula sp.]
CPGNGDEPSASEGCNPDYRRVLSATLTDQVPARAVSLTIKKTGRAVDTVFLHSTLDSMHNPAPERSSGLYGSGNFFLG